MITSPNHYHFIDFIKGKKVIFLISDPYHLSDPVRSDKVLKRTRMLYNRADIVLTTNKGLKENYIPQYISTDLPNKTHYWPNTVDLELWDFQKYQTSTEDNIVPIIGVAGNINGRTDLKLLDFITEKRPDYKFVLCGKNFLKQKNQIDKFDQIIQKVNVKYLGYVDFNLLPSIVSKWDVGLTIEGRCEYTQYVHHNKIYQYMALGLPVVTYKVNDEYNKLNDLICIPETYKAFVDNIDESIEKRKNNKFIEKLIKIALENSSMVRAEQFHKILEQNL